MNIFGQYFVDTLLTPSLTKCVRKALGASTCKSKGISKGVHWTFFKVSWYDPVYVETIRHEFNTWRPRQDGHHFAESVLNSILVNGNVRTSIQTSVKFFQRGPFENNQH